MSGRMYAVLPLISYDRPKHPLSKKLWKEKLSSKITSAIVRHAASTSYAMRPNFRIEFPEFGPVHIGAASYHFTTLKQSNTNGFWVLRQLDDEAKHQEDGLKAFAQLTSEEPSLFAPHRLVEANASLLSPRVDMQRHYLACAKNENDLLIHLAFYEFSLSPEVLFHVVNQSWRLLRAFNAAELAIDEVDLLDSFQVWELHPKQFEVRFGCFARFDLALPQKLSNYRNENEAALRKLLWRIKGITEVQYVNESSNLYEYKRKTPGYDTVCIDYSTYRLLRFAQLLQSINRTLRHSSLHDLLDNNLAEDYSYKMDAVYLCLQRITDIKTWMGLTPFKAQEMPPSSTNK